MTRAQHDTTEPDEPNRTQRTAACSHPLQTVGNPTCHFLTLHCFTPRIDRSLFHYRDIVG